MTSAAREPHFVRSLERGLAVIRVFGADRPELTLSQVAEACGLTRAAARRSLLTLADLGYVGTDGRHFRLTPRVLELGYAYLAGLTLPQLAGPHLRHLVEQTGSRPRCACWTATTWCTSPGYRPAASWPRPSPSAPASRPM